MPWIPSWIPFSDQHWTQTTHHEVEEDLVFLVAILQGDSWRRDTEWVSGHEWEEQWVCVTVSWTGFCVCRCPVWRCSCWSLERLGVTSGVLETPLSGLGISLQRLLHDLFPSDSGEGDRVGLLVKKEVTYTMHIPWKQIHYLQRWFQKHCLPTNEQPESRW
jgi:hypothetical protein